MRHLIQKQVFDLSAGSVKLARQWESRASDLLRDLIAPCMERCFDEAASEGKNLRIDLLEIDLGLLPDQVSGEEIWDKMRAELLPALRSCTAAAERSATGPLLSGEPGSMYEKNKAEVRELTELEVRLECLSHFLLHGKLPWWAETDQMELDSDWIGQLTDNKANSVIEMLSASKAARERLVQQFSVEFVGKLLSYSGWGSISDVLNSWNRLTRLSSVAIPATLSKAYWRYWLEQCFGSKAGHRELVWELNKWLAGGKKLKAAVDTLLKSQGDARQVTNKGVFSPVLDLLKSALGELNETAERQQALPDNQKLRTGEGHIGPEEGEDSNSFIPRTGKPLKTRKEEKASSGVHAEMKETNQTELASAMSPADSAEETATFVEAAGLILTHPFLAELFRTCDLRDEKDWKSPGARHLAVSLTAWLGHGDRPLPEYRLLMPKLLCGMPWEEPLDTTIALPARFIVAGTGLLEAMIGHWKALGNISAEGLREGFVSREGKLTLKEDGWLLSLEKKAQDILLTRLPWGISVIRLPWLRGRNIYVDWI